MIKIVIFDLDNVLVDLKYVHRDAFNESLRENGIQPVSNDIHEKEYNGFPTKIKLSKLGITDPYVISAVSKVKQNKTVEMIDRTLFFDREKKILCEKLKEVYKIGCVTNSVRETVKKALKRIGVYDYFDLIISNEDAVPKPSPDGYKKAIYELGVFAHEALIVEDSPVGIEAAVKSGAHVMKVKDPTEVTYENIIKYINLVNKGNK